MTLPVSGAISFADINLEIYGSASTAQVSLNDATVRNIFTQSSGTVDMNTAHGKAYTIPGNSGVLTSGSSFTLPRTSGFNIKAIAIAGGGGGGGGSGRTFASGYYTGGGGGGAGGNSYGATSVTPGSTISISIGGGGGGGGARDGIYSSGSNGSDGGATIVNFGSYVVSASTGRGGKNTPTSTGGIAGLAGSGITALLTPTDGTNGPSGATTGGPGAKGYTINTTVGTAVGSILGYGSTGIGYAENSGVYGVAGTGYGAGGTGGGCSQSDVYNYNNMYSTNGVGGAVFIWWGY